MTYSWEVLIQAARQKLPEDRITFVPACLPNPYMEINYPDLNFHEVGETSIEINTQFRFDDIFCKLLDGSLEPEYTEFRDTLFDILIHFLARIDLTQGMCKKEYYWKFLQQEIKNGGFGETNSQSLDAFTQKQMRYIQDAVVKLYSWGPSIALLRILLRQLYPHSMLYLDSSDKKELLIYIGQKKTPQKEMQIQFLQGFFVPLDYKVRLFWEMHFGIIGVEETMEIGEIMLY